MDQKNRDSVVRMAKNVQAKAKELKPAPYGMTLGMVGPVEGLWDPFGFSQGSPKVSSLSSVKLRSNTGVFACSQYWASGFRRASTHSSVATSMCQPFKVLVKLNCCYSGLRSSLYLASQNSSHLTGSITLCQATDLPLSSSQTLRQETWASTHLVCSTNMIQKKGRRCRIENSSMDVLP